MPVKACIGPVRSLANAASDNECKAFMLQADLARARSASAAAAEDASALRVEANSLRKALRAMEGRLAEYQAKDTEVREHCGGMGGMFHHTHLLCMRGVTS